jgi:DNA-binding SARP family transcriptional activator
VRLGEILGDVDRPSGETVYAEIERGLTYAGRAYFADAAAHFAVARTHLDDAESALLAALDAFLDSHSRYWTAQQSLHESTHRFVVASNDQEARLADLQESLSLYARDDQPSVNGAHRQAISVASPRDDRTSLLAGGQAAGHGLTIRCFGVFEVRRAATGERVELCRNRNGQAILRYLVAQPRRRAARDVLMEVFWPDDPPSTARHKLHVAVSALRRSLTGDDISGGYVVADDADYALDAAADIRVDLDDFEQHVRLGQRSAGTVALEHYEAACNLYVGPFLREDLYADWSQLRREQVAQSYLMMCGALATAALQEARFDDAARWAMAALAEDRCNEAAYRQLIRARAMAGRRVDALHQYQQCVQVLADELGVQPLPETTALFHTLIRGEELGPIERA